MALIDPQGSRWGGLKHHTSSARDSLKLAQHVPKSMLGHAQKHQVEHGVPMESWILVSEYSGVWGKWPTIAVDYCR